MWEITISGKVDEREAEGVTSERYDTWAEGLDAFVATLESLDVTVFGPYVSCECDRSTCDPCDLLGVARAAIADGRSGWRADEPVWFTWPDGELVVRLGRPEPGSTGSK